MFCFLHIAGYFPSSEGLIAPGMYCSYVVKFTPDSLTDYEEQLSVSDSIRELRVLYIIPRVDKGRERVSNRAYTVSTVSTIGKVTYIIHVAKSLWSYHMCIRTCTVAEKFGGELNFAIWHMD